MSFVPLTTTIEGVGVYKQVVTVNWAGLTSPIGIVAVRGAGKTWIHGTPFAVLYGYFPWYSDSPPNI